MADVLQVFQMQADHESHRWLGVARTNMLPLGLLLRGQPLRQVWDPPEVEELLDHELPTGPIGDCAYLSAVPTFSQRAVEALRPLLELNGELLPVRCACGEYYVYNVTRVLDALDERQSDVTYFESSGRVMTIDTHVFSAAALVDASIFRIPQIVASTPFVTSRFVSLVHEHALTGFDFLPLWTGEV